MPAVWSPRGNRDTDRRILVAYNNVATFIVPRALYVPVNVGVGAGLVALARRRGVSWGDLGIRRAAVAPGVRWGGGVALVAAVVLAAALSVPAGRDALNDRRFADRTAGSLAYETLVRIPVGTAAFEEVAFRGVLYAALASTRSFPWTAAVSGAAFGLWHIGPTLQTLDVNALAPGITARIGVVSASVALTAVGGVLLALLRRRSGGLIGPILAHAALNSFGALAATAVAR